MPFQSTRLASALVPSMERELFFLSRPLSFPSRSLSAARPFLSFFNVLNTLISAHSFVVFRSCRP